jgi:hypothetical protein
MNTWISLLSTLLASWYHVLYFLVGLALHVLVFLVDVVYSLHIQKQKNNQPWGKVIMNCFLFLLIMNCCLLNRRIKCNFIWCITITRWNNNKKSLKRRLEKYRKSISIAMPIMTIVLTAQETTKASWYWTKFKNQGLYHKAKFVHKIQVYMQQQVLKDVAGTAA